MGDDQVRSGEDPVDQGAVGGSQPRKEAAAPHTAICPFCLDSINVHARRCRHCGADLEQPDVPSGDGQQVVYVVDRGIVRFVKVSLSVFGLLSIAGLYVLGIDLKRTVSEIHKLRGEIVADGKVVATQSKAIATQSKTVGTQSKAVATQSRTVDAAKQTILADVATVKALRADIESDAKSAKRVLTSVSALQADVQSRANVAKLQIDALLKTVDKKLVLAETLSIGRDGEATVRTSVSAVDRDRTERRPFKLWEPGTALHVRFLGGTTAEQDAVKNAAQEWLKHANIQFVFDDSPEAQIRISFEAGTGSWSHVGTDSLDFDSVDEPTMNYGWSILEDRDTILHNFGHALGLLHEHQNPLSGLQWDEDAVYEFYSSPPNNWLRETTFHNIIRKYSADAYAFAKPFDPNSIMMYAFGSGLLKPPFEGGVTPKAGLSSEDIEFIGKLYPKSP